MKKIITLVVDGELAKDIFEDYVDFADFVSIQTEDEAAIKRLGYDTWDNLDWDDEDEDAACDCGEDNCDCDTKI